MRKEALSRCDRRRVRTAAAARGEGVGATDGGARASSMVKELGGLELGKICQTKYNTRKICHRREVDTLQTNLHSPLCYSLLKIVHRARELIGCLGCHKLHKHSWSTIVCNPDKTNCCILS